MKLRGAVGHMYLPQEKVFGEIFRCLITAQFLTPSDDRFGQLTFSPTWQNFPKNTTPYADFDLYLTQLKARNVHVMANLLNGFNKKYSLPLKALPKNAPGLSSDDMASWTLYRKMLEQFTLRYGKTKDDSKIDIAENSIVWNGKPQAPQTKVSGLNLVSSIQVLNEMQNTWVKPDAEGRLSGIQYAHVLKYVVDGIWSIDPQMMIVAGPTAGWDKSFWIDFFNTWTVSYGSFPHFNPATKAGIAISFNQYLFGGCGVWGKCRVKDPAVEIPKIAGAMNVFLKQYGAYAMITEHGCGTELSSDLGYFDYAGLDKYQSQAKFIIDSTNLWLSYSQMIAATFYQFEDDPNEPRFQYTGVLENNTLIEKPSYAIIKDAFAKPFVPVEIPTEPPPPPPPTITTMEIRISASTTRAPFEILQDGAVITPGKYLVFAEPQALKTPVTFELIKNNVVVIPKRNESGYPYDMNGGPAYDFTAGEYILKVTSGTGTTMVSDEINFTVGNATPPPPAKEPVTETWIENGKVFFKTATKTYSTPVE